ncbi:MAG: efflux RND transporter periplasmic adaptor subunit [Verrucomicrobia bacterium]|nr:efflux RND transporter periplasmic adaptor subunit [Verrucomicrobiota bacterium]
MKMSKRGIAMVVLSVVAGMMIGRSCAGNRGADADLTSMGHDEATVKFWTCSMHPEIQLPDPGKCPKCAMDLIPVMASKDSHDDPTSLRELKLSPAAEVLAGVETARVERRFATAEIRMVGKVDFDETRLAYLTARVPGRLDRLYVDYTGVEVKQGDHMVSIYSPELLAAQEELIQAVQTVENVSGSDSSLIRGRTAATVISAREKLRLWGLTDGQISEIEARGKSNDHLTIFSPISGIVIHKNALEGAYVQTGTRIYTIADLSQVWIKLDAYESDLSWVHYGQDVDFQTEAYPGRTFRGTIAFIDPVLNEKTRTVKVRVNVDNRSGDLKPGMFVRATVRADIAIGSKVFSSKLAGKWISPMHPEIVKDEPGSCDICGMQLVSAESLGYVLGNAEEAPLVIPASAPLITGKRAIVYVKSPDRRGVFEGREIVLGPRAGDYYLVRRGLREGEEVVTRGNFKLDAELQIHAKPSMMTPEGGGGGGHNHGGSISSGSSSAEVAGSMSMSRFSSEERAMLQAVIAAAQAADDSVKGGDLEEIRVAFARLQERVDTVTMDDISGHDALLWKEYAMLLGNDALEGSAIETVSDVLPIASLLREHMASMRQKIGLASTGRATAPMPATHAAFLAQFSHLVEGYLNIQAALASDDREASVAAAKEASLSLGAFDVALGAGDKPVAWMQMAMPFSRTLGQLSKAQSLADSRAALAPLSETMMAAIKRFGAPTTALYMFHCPMALDGSGAAWIQDEAETRNPYFGEAMLGCGSVIDTVSHGTQSEAHHDD